MRYFIEVKPWAIRHLVHGGHIGKYGLFPKTLCGEVVYDQIIEVDAPINCEDCLAILKKQGGG